MEHVGAVIAEVDTVASAIAAAVEQQGAATLEIARRVQDVAAANGQATGTMQIVSGLAERSGGLSREVLNSAAQISAQTGELHGELNNFLDAMREENGDRRRYERLAAEHLRARLTIAGREHANVVRVRDVSRGGIALDVALSGVAPGAEAEVRIDGITKPVPGRVARVAEDHVAISFRQSREALAAADAVLALVDGLQQSAA